MLDDIAMGFFIVFEDLFSVGDFIEVDGATGTVVEIGLRSVKIRVLTGETVIIPNGNINKVINHSISNGQAVVDISVAYEADLNKALSTLEEVATRTFDLYDEIYVEKRKEGITIDCNKNYVPTDSRNLAYKAAMLFKEKYNIKEGVYINIIKNIPVSAGLAGGSTDGAAVLKLMNKLLKLMLQMKN